MNVHVALFCVALIAWSRSPGWSQLEYLFVSDTTGSSSNDLVDDALLDVPDLVRKYNYPMEEHYVITDDGYVLGVHRIPCGRDANNKPGDRPAVLLIHGMFSSSADYVITGPERALGYQLADAGYDVWMGNNRGNFYSRRHLLLDPDSRTDTNFWHFSWDEIGNKDLPAMIDYILDNTGKSALHYIGISQGSTVFFVMGSLRPEYNEKIISMHALGPTAYMGRNRNRLIVALSSQSGLIENIATSLGLVELFPRSDINVMLGRGFCSDGSVTQVICSTMLFMLFGWSEDQHNATMLPTKIGHAPAGAALGQVVHYAQCIIEKEFRQYDHGAVTNLAVYGSQTPPYYDLSKITAPVHLHYAERDPFAELEDLDRLLNELGGPVQKHRVPLATFGHVDFMWGIDANRLVYDLVIDIMRSYDARSEPEE